MASRSKGKPMLALLSAVLAVRLNLKATPLEAQNLMPENKQSTSKHQKMQKFTSAQFLVIQLAKDRFVRLRIP